MVSDKQTEVSPVGPELAPTQSNAEDAKDFTTGQTDYHGIDLTQVQPGADASYEAKITILNQALIDIGMGPFQWKIFATTGFGWFIDNLWMQAISNIQPPVKREFGIDRIAFLSMSKFAGLIVGASFWPITSDFIGRRLAFNVTMLITAMSGLIGAGSPTFSAICILSGFIGIGTGGNQPVDSAIFLEYIPATHQNVLVMQSAFWSVGQVVSALVAWVFIVNFCCPPGSTQEQCGYSANLGWRYSYWALGGLTTVLFLLRFFFRIYETPKYLLGRGKDAKAVEVVHSIAARDNKTTWLSLEHFQAVDARLAVIATEDTDTGPRTTMQRSLDKFAPQKVRALFSTPRMALSTTMILFLWTAIGIGFPLYTTFIPIYLENRSGITGATNLNTTYRNLTIQFACGIPASILGGFTVNMKRIGRKGTGCFACLATSVFLFLFTRADTPAGVLGFSCGTAFFQNLVYGLLYSYTPELFPAPIRGTGNGLVMLFNRFGGLSATIIGAYVGLDTDLPIWISAAMFAVTGILFLLLPYESRGKAAS